MNYNQVNDFGQEAGNGGQMGGMLSDGMEGLTGKNMQTELAAKLQTTVVGGYTKKSVEEYALEMRNNLMLIKMQLEQQIRELTAEKVSVTQECQVLREQLNTAEEKLSDAIALKERAMQEARLSAAKLEEWENQHSDYEEMQLQKEMYEEEISQKEQDIIRLNGQLSNYQHDYEALQARMKNMEEDLLKVSLGLPQPEMEEMLRQKEEAEQKYEKLLMKMEENAIALEQERQARKEEQEQQNLMTERGKWEQQALIAEREKLEQQILSAEKERSEHQALIAEREKQEQQALAAEKEKWEKKLNDLKNQYEEQENYKRELEEKVDVLYKNYEENSSWIKRQEQQIEEKDMLLKHYQVQEQGAILTRQENQKLKDTIDSLKETIQMIMEQMETQSESMNLYMERTTQERDTLKKAIGEQAALKLQNVELLDIQRGLLAQIEELKSRNMQLEKGMELQKKVSLPVEREKRAVLPEKQPSVSAERESSDPELFTCDKAMQKARGLFSVMEGEYAEKTREVKNIG
ncbi:hypothetical protein LAD12857_17540 [Lacrimispora amygdalina]|uniref:Uncharacterized protein n=1 Tax=Lacrimispora amygdalina TaxID=253257 RepID=A0ABQ5M4F3_9FIRM